MSIVTPPIYTPVHEEEIKTLSPHSEEIFRKLVRNNNFLLDLAPVGTIIFVNINQQGGGQPNAAMWQPCDGSEITNSLSPLRSIGLNLRFTPDLRTFYPRGAVNDTSTSTGGSHNHNLQHSHTTGLASVQGPPLDRKGGQRRRNAHGHVLFAQYDNPTFIEAPAYVYLVAYLKIV
jgi:hypothetical protein